MMHKAGLVSYYGLSVMCDLGEYVAINSYTRAAFENTLLRPVDKFPILPSDFCAWETEKVWWTPENTNISRPSHANTDHEILQGTGKVTGQLLGGCIDVFPQLIGTPLWPSLQDWKGKLLLIETSEADMSEDWLCWMLRGLYAQGLFNVINGIIVGKPAYKSKYEAYKEIYRKVVGFEAKRPDLPILYNVNVGHAYPIGLFPLGLNYEIDCTQRALTLLEPATTLSVK